MPFVAWGPGRVHVGKTEAEVVCLTDLMATVANLVGYKLPNDAAEDSYDIGAAIFGKRRDRPLREATVHHSMNNEYGLRQGDWVLIDSPFISKKTCARRRTCTRSIPIGSERCERCSKNTKQKAGAYQRAAEPGAPAGIIRIGASVQAAGWPGPVPR